ncbi:aspartic proteinase CDR1-like [Corylus avellana]|uniref:aspartic proteinase CDR1-like n=1 Tax=Corylus avellana TaxID=13451 RepID=UPI00286C8372|nr:aspartic proteinase CDR1-like [Corylus avellana]
MSFGNGSEVLGDEKYLPYNISGTVSVGNVFLDSGTPEMYLPQDFHDRLVAEVKQQILSDSIAVYLPRLCYINANNLNVPILTVHFEGADVLLMPIHTFEAENGITCFEVYPSNNNIGDGFGLYGNYAQSNFLIGYDMEKMTVSFKPTDCTKY